MTKLEQVLEQTTIIVEGDTSYRVNVVDLDEQAVYVTDEDSGEEYLLHFDEIDLSTMKFYKLTQIEL